MSDCSIVIIEDSHVVDLKTQSPHHFVIEMKPSLWPKTSVRVGKKRELDDTINTVKRRRSTSGDHTENLHVERDVESTKKRRYLDILYSLFSLQNTEHL